VYTCLSTGIKPSIHLSQGKEQIICKGYKNRKRTTGVRSGIITTWRVNNSE